MIESKKILYSEGNNDECYTPGYGVDPILKYIPQGVIVWCPFDTEDSEFVQKIRSGGGYRYIKSYKRRKRLFGVGARSVGYDSLKSTILREKADFGKGIEFLKAFCSSYDEYMAEGFRTEATIQRKRSPASYVR